LKNPFSIEDHRSRFRIIPEWDKMPRVVAIAGTIYGKITLVSVNLVLLWSFFLHLHWSLVVLGVFLVFSPLAINWKFVLSLLWVSLFGLRDSEFGVFNFGELNRVNTRETIANLYALAGDHLLAYRFFILIGSAGIFFVFAIFAKNWRPRWPFLWLLGVWGLLLGVAEILPANTLGSLYGWGLFCEVGRCFFGAMYLLLAVNAIGLSTLSKFIFPLQGVLLGTGNNFLRSPTLLSQPDFANDEEKARHLAVCLIKSVKLLLWTRLITFAMDILNYGAYGSSNAWLPTVDAVDSLSWSDPFVLGFQQYNQLGAPLLQSWSAVCLHTLNFIAILCASSGVSIAFVRMSGIYIPRDTFRPYAAKSFNEFLRRLLFYYSEILVNIFIYPIWENLRFLIRYKKLRLALTLLGGVGLGGWLAHMIFMGGYFVMAGGALNGFYFFVKWIPYFLLLGIACTISALGILRKYLDPLLPTPLKVSLIFVFYSLLLTTAHGYSLDGGIIDNWNARLIFICSLFGF